jgi:transcriptional regulator with XRE-family HTH domain
MRGSPRRRFGEHIRELRKARTLTQEELAERSALSVDAIRRIERDAFSPSLETVRKLTVGLDLSLRTLFQGLDGERRDPVQEICDFLGRRSGREVRLAWRVLRAMFEDKESKP